MYLPFPQEKSQSILSWSTSTSKSLENVLENIPSCSVTRALHRSLMLHNTLLIDCPFSFPKTRPKWFCKQVRVCGSLPELVHSALTSAFGSVSMGLNTVFCITLWVIRTLSMMPTLLCISQRVWCCFSV